MDQRYQYIKLLKNNSNYDGKKRQNILEVNLLHELIACFYEIYVFRQIFLNPYFPGIPGIPGFFQIFPGGTGKSKRPGNWKP